MPGTTRFRTAGGRTVAFDELIFIKALGTVIDARSIDTDAAWTTAVNQMFAAANWPAAPGGAPQPTAMGLGLGLLRAFFAGVVSINPPG